MDNVISLQDMRYLKSRREVVCVTELCGTKVGHYKAHVKSQIMMFIYKQVSDLEITEAIEKLQCDENEYSLLKNLRVSQFDIDRLFELSFNIGYTFELLPHDISEDME